MWWNGVVVWNYYCLNGISEAFKWFQEQIRSIYKLRCSMYGTHTYTHIPLSLNASNPKMNIWASFNFIYTVWTVHERDSSFVSLSLTELNILADRRFDIHLVYFSRTYFSIPPPPPKRRQENNVKKRELWTGAYTPAVTSLGQPKLSIPAIIFQACRSVGPTLNSFRQMIKILKLFEW